MNSRWYILYCLSGHEKKVAQTIMEKANSKGLVESFEDVVVPTEGVVEIRKGKKVNAEKKIFPGYVLVKMVMNDETWHLVRNIPKVTNFLGANNKPQPIPDAEVKRIFEQIEQAALAPKHTDSYEIGQSVKIIDGPFEGFVGVVEEVDQAKARLKLSVSIFGRATPIELEYGQVTKI
ncbi:MAG: transcription termination/antitermination protein NusG [Sphingobacteriia bacterium]|nr:transcription termination/antitermination protein NusG [Sphingobacteriia bacterium]